MIARMWRGVTPEAKAAAYLDYLRETGLKEYKATPGNRGVWVLQRLDAGQSEFLLVSLWESWADIKRFAGENYQQAVYYPQDPDFLLELPSNVEHYEVLVAI